MRLTANGCVTLTEVPAGNICTEAAGYIYIYFVVAHQPEVAGEAIRNKPAGNQGFVVLGLDALAPATPL